MKKVALTLAVLVLVGALVVTVFAWQRGGCWGRWSHGLGYCCQGGGLYGDLTEDQRAKMDKLEQKFYNDTAKLREEIRTKSEELNTLLNASDPDPKELKALQKEISDLRANMAQQRIDFELEARKIAPNGSYARGCARGFGRHMRGHGPHRGRGYGRGSCWD